MAEAPEFPEQLSDAADVATFWPTFWAWAATRSNGTDAEDALRPLIGYGMPLRGKNALGPPPGAGLPFPPTVYPSGLAPLPPTAVSVGGYKPQNTGSRPVVHLGALDGATTPLGTLNVARAVLAWRTAADNVALAAATPGADRGARQLRREAANYRALAAEWEPRIPATSRPWLAVLREAYPGTGAPLPIPQPLTRVPIQFRK